jgi:hypothetical protein
LFTVIHEKKSAVDTRIYFQTANETIARIAHEDERRNNPMNKKQTYFTDNIEPAVDFASKYYLEELGIQHLEMLMTNNASGNLNLQIAQFRQKKGLETPKNLEEQIMEFKNYDDCKAREVMKAYYAQGMYRLKEKYREDFEKDVSLMPAIDLPSKEEIIEEKERTTC